MKDSSLLPRLGITMGDPMGIGPEILVKALGHSEIYTKCRPIIVGDEKIIRQTLSLLSLDLHINSIQDAEEAVSVPGTLDLINLSAIDTDMTREKSPTASMGRAMEAYILHGIDMAMQKQIDALVTCPITKTALKLAGSQFHGHTELLAHRTRAKQFAMMLAGERLKVVLATIHIPLASVPQALSADTVLNTIEITHTALQQRFGVKAPRVAVAGLNPHAGEDAMFGSEEENLILPAVHTARNKGIKVVGPLPPDTVFYKAVNGDFDAVVCMYHDQGLIPFKLIHFEDGVNTTLGLPIIRTSVDHGTAYDIAWKGIADPTSLMEAIKMAALQAQNQAQNEHAR